MAALNTLRTKGSVILTVAIGVSLLAFLVGDGMKMFGNNNVSVGIINETPVSYREYSTAVEKQTSITQQMMNTSSLSSEQAFQVQTQVWNRFISDIAILPMFNQLGLNVTDDELLDMTIGDNVSPYIMQLFSNPETGLFDKQNVINFVSNLDANPANRTLWSAFEKEISDNRANEKFTQLVTAGMFVTDLQAQQSFDNQKDSYAIEYLTKSINSIQNSDVTVTDAELKSYYDKHIARFEYNESSEVEYVTFDIVPSADDFAKAEANSLKVAGELAEATDIEQFVNFESDKRFDGTYYNQEQLPSYLLTSIENAKIGDTFDPYFSNNTYYIARVKDIKVMPDSVKLRSVVVASAKADSLINVAKAKGGFDSVVATSALGDKAESTSITIPMGSLNSQYMDKFLAAKAGDIVSFDMNGATQLVNIESFDKKTTKYQIGEVELAVVPSSTTETEIYTQASNFANTVSAGADFATAVSDNQFIKRNATVNVADQRFANMDNSRELVRWSFTAKEGDASHVINVDDKNIVAFLKKRMNKGTAPFDAVKEDVKNDFIAKKKMDMTLAELSGATSLDALASKLDTEIATATDVTYSMYAIPGIGIAPELVGALTTLPENTVSKPIAAGTVGAVVKIISKDQNEGMDLAKAKLLLESESSSYMDMRLAAALVNGISVEDKRVIYY